MSIEAIGQVSPDAEILFPASGATASTTNFTNVLKEELNAVNAQMVSAERELRELSAGRQTNLHHVMLKLEEAKISFHLLVQVRTKVLEAYQELMRTQI